MEIFSAVVIIIEIAMLVGLVNACLPRFMAAFVNGCVRIVTKPFVMAFRLTHEPALYFLAITFCAQSTRYPVRQAQDAVIHSHVGGVLMVLCWIYSMRLHKPAACDVQWMLFAIAVYLFWSFLPLSLISNSQIHGFVAMAALHGAWTLLLLKVGFGGRFGYGWKRVIPCGALSSLAILTTLITMGATVHAGLIQVRIQPLTLAGALLGHIAYFAMMLLLSSKWVANSEDYTNLQCIMGISWSVTMFIGTVFQVAAFSSTAYAALILFLMVKEIEHKFDVLGMKILAVYVLYTFLDKDGLWTMLDPHGLYLPQHSSLTNSGL
jgi:hypothetical protein